MNGVNEGLCGRRLGRKKIQIEARVAVLMEKKMGNDGVKKNAQGRGGCVLGFLGFRFFCIFMMFQNPPSLW